jgi:hypothetical protein
MICHREVLSLNDVIRLCMARNLVCQGLVKALLPVMRYTGDEKEKLVAFVH